MGKFQERPEPVWIVTKEGGDLKPFQKHERLVAHAIYFSDGSQFDFYNGWRNPEYTRKPVFRVKAGRRMVRVAA